ncbi:MAG: heme-binding protein, partial [Burkholderiales bacterium]
MAEHLRAIESSLALSVAAKIVDAAIAIRAKEALLPLAVAVLDAGGNLVAFKREDGCGVLRFDIARGKAWAALGMG